MRLFLGKYPIVPLLFRVCNEDFRLPDSNLVVPKGTEMMIPVLGIHRNPEIYDNPMEFRPERFLESSTGSTSATKGCYYLPFGYVIKDVQHFAVEIFDVTTLCLISLVMVPEIASE